MTIENQDKVRRELHRSEDFRSKYANVSFFETSVYDMRVNWGEIARLEGGHKAVAEYHSSITTSWLEAKVAGLFWLLNVYNYERQNGTITIPDAVKPEFLSKEDAQLPMRNLIPILSEKFNSFTEKMAQEAKADAKKK